MGNICSPHARADLAHLHHRETQLKISPGLAFTDSVGQAEVPLGDGEIIPRKLSSPGIEKVLTGIFFQGIK